MTPGSRQALARAIAVLRKRGDNVFLRFKLTRATPSPLTSLVYVKMSQPTQIPPPRKRAVVAVVASENQLLVIRRSRFVVAPGQVCFPGGKIEPGESTPDALVREIDEELGTECIPEREIWLSRTPWGTQVHWWAATLPRPLEIKPNTAEVADCFWINPAKLQRLPDLLVSNAGFLDAWHRAEFEVPLLTRSGLVDETAG